MIAGLNRLYGVAFDAARKIYVTNYGNNTLTTYDANGKQAIPTTTGLNGPIDVAVDTLSHVFRQSRSCQKSLALSGELNHAHFKSNEFCVHRRRSTHNTRRLLRR